MTNTIGNHHQQSPRPSRDDIGLLVAMIWSQRATCVRRKVGCLLVDKDNRTLSTGYNGPPAGAPHCIDTPCAGAFKSSGIGLDLCEAIHAEANALLYCPDTRLIHTCYTTTSPCVGCVKFLLGTGCQRIVFAEIYPHKEAEEWWKRAGREWVQHIPTGYATFQTTMALRATTAPAQTKPACRLPKHPSHCSRNGGDYICEVCRDDVAAKATAQLRGGW